MKFAVIGDAFVDGMIGPIDQLPSWGNDVIIPHSIEWLAGGSSINTALYLKSLGHEVTWYGAIGEDDHGSFLQKTLEDSGIVFKGSVLKTTSTGTCLVLIGASDRAFLTHGGATTLFTIQDILLSEIKKMDHVHIAGYYNCRSLHTDLPSFCQEIQSAGVTISCDPNGDGEQKWTCINTIWSYIDVLLPNEIEAMGMTGATKVEDASTILSRTIPLVVITCGNKGVVVGGSQYEIRIQHEAIPISNIVDPTGAGDAFDAGFLHGWKTSGVVQEGIKIGLSLAYFVLGHRGASNVRPCLDEIKEMYKDEIK